MALKLYEAFDESKTWAEWKADPRFIINERTVRSRLASGWTLDRAMSEGAIHPPLREAFGEERQIKDWFSDPRCVVKPDTVHSRLQAGWSLEDALITPTATLYDGFGESKSIYMWVRDPRSKIKSEKLLRRRIEEEGMTLEEAIRLPGDTLYRAFGERKTLAEWLQDSRCIVPLKTIYSRLNNWHTDNFEIIITESLHETQRYEAFGKNLTISEWIEQPECQVDQYKTLYSRMYDYNLNIEDAISLKTMRNTSSLENEIADYIESLIDIERNDRKLISPFELDIYIPSRNIAIEFNGVYWHSEKFKGKYSHQQKYFACKSKGVQLIQIWEDDWLYRRNIVENCLRHKLGLAEEKVFARKTTVCQVAPQEAKLYLEQNHIQGATGSTVRMGLRDQDDRLVALGCFKKVNDKDAQWDLVRYTSSIQVVGGFSKILSAFRKEHEGAIKTFADLCISDGNLYEQTGFQLVKILDPDYRYIRSGSYVREHKFGYRKNNFKNREDLIYEEDKSESELAAMNGLLRVYDAGKARYLLL